MNKLEYEIVEVLKKLKNDFGVFEIKAEFEAEGSRIEEMMRLKDVTSKVDLPIILKIGGVEAVTDIYNAISIGVKGIIAPMVETPFALLKYLNMIKMVIAEDNAKDIEFAFNLETITAVNNLDDMLKLDLNPLKSVTLGRVDLSGSMGVGRAGINSETVYQTCLVALSKIKALGLRTALGGAIAKESFAFINNLSLLLDKYETRKVVFPISSLRFGEEAIIEANRFELLWIENKRKHYTRISAEDETRIRMLRERVK